TGGAPPAVDLSHPDVVLDHPEGAHLVLRLRGPRVLRARLGESGNAAGLEHPAHLAQHLVRIRQMMKRVETEDPVDTFVGQLEPASVEGKKTGRWLFSEDRIARIELPADFPSRLGDVARDHAHAALCQGARG